MSEEKTTTTTTTEEVPHAPGNPKGAYQTATLQDVLEPEDAELTEEELLRRRYQQPPVPVDPNKPVNPTDPNDRIRAEGPEVADPAQEAAHMLFDEAVEQGEKAAKEAEAKESERKTTKTTKTEEVVAEP